MAKYRLIRQTKGHYKVIGLYSPAKGGSQQLVVVDATLNQLGQKTKQVAEAISDMRPKREPAVNDASEPGRGVTK